MSETRDITAGPGKARDKSQFQRLARSRHDDRNCRRRLFRDHDGPGSDRHDYIDIPRYEIPGIFGKAVPIRVTEPSLHDIIAPLPIPQVIKALLEVRESA